MPTAKLSGLEKKLIERLLQLKPKLTTLLEIGCGDGKKLIYLQRQYNIKVSGIDIYEPYIRNLKKLGISAYLGDARKLPYADRHFSWVLVANMLHHVPDPDTILSEAFRVTKNGMIVVEPWFDTSIVSQQLSAELNAWCKKLHQSLGYFHREGLNAGEIMKAINFEISDIEIYYEFLLEELNFKSLINKQKKHIKKLSQNHYLLWELKQINYKIKDYFISNAGQVVVIIKK